MAQISAGANRNVKFRYQHQEAEPVRLWGRPTRGRRVRPALAPVRFAERSRTGSRETTEVQPGPCSHFSSDEWSGTGEESIPRGVAQDVRGRASHVLDWSAPRTSRQRAPPFEAAEATTSLQSLWYWHSSLETRLRPRRLDSGCLV